MKRLLHGVLLALLLVPAPSFAAYQAIGKAEDAAHSDGDYGVMSLCVRKDTSTTGIGANGDYVPCAVNASGYVYTTADVTAVVPGTGASSLGKAEDAAHGSGDTGVFVMGRRIDTAAASSGTSGDYEAFNMDSSGRLWVNPGVIGIEDAAETAGGNLAMIGSVRRDTAASSAGATGDNATLNTDATGRLWSNTEMPDAAAISADDQSAPTAPATYAFLMCFDGSAWDRCIGSGNYVEDAASAGAEQVILSGGVRQDTLASNTSADGDYTYNKYTSAGRLYTSATVDAALPAGTNNIGDVDAIQSGTWTVQPGNTANTTPWLTTIHQGGNAAVVNGSGQLSVTCANCSGSGASFVDDAAFTVGTSSGAPAMGMLDETTPDTVNEGDVGVVRMSANRNLYVQLRDNAGNERGLNIDSNGALAAVVSATNLDVQSGGADLATEATAAAILTSTNFAAAFGTAGSADSQVMSVQGIASMTPLQVQSNSGNLLLESTITALVLATQADDVVNTTDTLQTSALGYMFDGTTWDRMRGDSTNGLLVNLGANNDVTVTSGNITVSATNLDVQSGGADLATEATAAAILTSTNFAAAFGTAGSADSQVMSVQGIASMTPLLTQPQAVATGGSDGYSYISVGTTEDEHAVKASAGTLYSVTATNTNAAVRYLKCENDTAANTAPGTDTPELRIAIPGATTGAGFTANLGPTGWAFSTALTCWLVTGAADSDVAEVAANEIMVFYSYK